MISNIDTSVIFFKQRLADPTVNHKQKAKIDRYFVRYLTVGLWGFLVINVLIQRVLIETRVKYQAQYVSILTLVADLKVARARLAHLEDCFATVANDTTIHSYPLIPADPQTTPPGPMPDEFQLTTAPNNCFSNNTPLPVIYQL